jgi:NADH dehydrogenase
MPFAVARILARLFDLLPSPPLTTGQVDLLMADNVASRTLPGFQELYIQPKSVEEVVPTYMRATEVDAQDG